MSRTLPRSICILWNSPQLKKIADANFVMINLFITLHNYNKHQHRQQYKQLRKENYKKRKENLPWKQIFLWKQLSDFQLNLTCIRYYFWYLNFCDFGAIAHSGTILFTSACFLYINQNFRLILKVTVTFPCFGPRVVYLIVFIFSNLLTLYICVNLYLLLINCHTSTKCSFTSRHLHVLVFLLLTLRR